MEAIILRYRYVMLLSMKDIARKMHYTLRWTQMIHVKALTHFETLHPTSSRVRPLGCDTIKL